MRASIALVLAVCSIPVTGLLVASAAAPRVRAATPVFAVQPDVARAKRNVPRKVDPKLAAVAVSLLRRFADDAKDPTDLDLALRSRLKRVPGARATAKRLLARIDGLPATKLEQTFGRDTKVMRARHSAATVAQLAPSSALDFGSIWEKPAVVIPAEGVAQPQTVALLLAGVASTAASDADGADELVVVSDWVTTSSSSASATAPASGTVALALGGAVASGAEIYNGADKAALLVSAVFEDDGGSAATAREDYHAMIQLAQALSDGLAGSDALTRLELAISTCSGLLAISSPELFGAGAVVWTRFGGSGSTLHDLYATPASQTGGVAWKTRHDHSVGGGSYEVLFDAPAPPPPDLTKVSVKLVSVKSLETWEHEPADKPKTKHDLAIGVWIRNGYGSWDFPNNNNNPSAGFAFTRIVLPGKVHLEIGLNERAIEQDGCWWGGWGGTNCGWGTPLDIRAGADVKAKLDYDPATGNITGDATGKAGDQLTLEGQSDSEPNGRVVIVVTSQ
jgi:hypothetical protein